MQKYVIALYIRLSLEDYKYDSMSIENQHPRAERVRLFHAGVH